MCYKVGTVLYLAPLAFLLTSPTPPDTFPPRLSPNASLLAWWIRLYKLSMTLYGMLFTVPVAKAGVNPLLIGIGGGILFTTFPTFPT